MFVSNLKMIEFCEDGNIRGKYTRILWKGNVTCEMCKKDREIQMDINITGRRTSMNNPKERTEVLLQRLY